MHNPDQFTRHLRCKGIRVQSTEVPEGWFPHPDLAACLYHDISHYERWWETEFTGWRMWRLVSCLKIPCCAFPWPSRGAELPKPHIAA